MTGIQVVSIIGSLVALAFSVYAAYRVGVYRSEQNHHLKRIERANQQLVDLQQRNISLLKESEIPTNEYRSPRGLETK